MTEGAIIALAVAILSAAGSIYSVRSTRRKSDADASESISRAASALVDTQNEHIAIQDNRIEAQDRCIDTLRLDIKGLRTELAEATRKIEALTNKLARANQRIEVLEGENAVLHQQLREAKGQLPQP